MQSLQSDFIDQVDSNSFFTGMFEHIPGVSFFAKNADLQLVCGNRAFWSRLGFSSEEQMIGKTDFELFPASLAENFRRDDLEVLETGKPKLKIIELFFNRQSLPDWYLTNKFPVRNAKGKVIGLMGTVENYERHQGTLTSQMQINEAVNYLRDHYREPVVISELAKQVGMSVRQFNRRFQEVFGTSPRSFLIKTRVHAACDELRRNSVNIAELAVDLGFYDQSSFTQHFRKHMGITPLQYRKGRAAR